MEIHQPLDFSSASPLHPHPHPVSVLDLCVRSDSSASRSPSPLYHSYNNNNNNNIISSKSYVQEQLKQQHLMLQARMEVDEHGPVLNASDEKPLQMPVLSVLQHQLLPRSSASAFGPAPRRRRTSSGLPDSPLGSSDERSEMGSTAASPPLDLLVGSPSSPGALSIPQQVMAAGAGRNGKPTRPFKAYPKDPLSLTAGVPGVSAAEAALGRASNEAYAEFRRRMLAQVQAATSPANKTLPRRSVSPPRLADSCQQASSPPLPAISPQDPADSTNASSPEPCGTPGQTVGIKDGKDAAYWERRRKNNEAAKRSRDARRAKEDEIAIRAAFLEQENLKLKYEVAALRSETAKLRCLLYSGSN